MSADMPIARPPRRGTPRGWAAKTPQPDATAAQAKPSSPSPDAPPAPAPQPSTDTAPAVARGPEPSRPFTLRLRASTEQQLDALLAPLQSGRVDRTELIHALIEAADLKSAKAAVLARRHRHSTFD